MSQSRASLRARLRLALDSAPAVLRQRCSRKLRAFALRGFQPSWTRGPDVAPLIRSGHGPAFGLAPRLPRASPPGTLGTSAPFSDRCARLRPSACAAFGLAWSQAALFTYRLPARWSEFPGGGGEIAQMLRQAVKSVEQFRPRPAEPSTFGQARAIESQKEECGTGVERHPTVSTSGRPFGRASPNPASGDPRLTGP